MKSKIAIPVDVLYKALKSNINVLCLRAFYFEESCRLFADKAWSDVTHYTSSQAQQLL